MLKCPEVPPPSLPTQGLSPFPPPPSEPVRNVRQGTEKWGPCMMGDTGAYPHPAHRSHFISQPPPSWHFWTDRVKAPTLAVTAWRGQVEEDPTSASPFLEKHPQPCRPGGRSGEETHDTGHQSLLCPYPAEVGLVRESRSWQVSPNLSPGRGVGCFLRAPISSSLKLNLPSAVGLLNHPRCPAYLQLSCPSRPWRRGTPDQGPGHYPSDTSQAGLEVLSRDPQGTCFS